MRTFTPGTVYWLRRRGDRPNLQIECMETRREGNCQRTAFFRVTTTRKLSLDDLKNLYHLGWLGIGQDFRLLNELEEKEVVEPVLIGEDGEPDWTKPVINEWSGEPYEKHERSYWVYNVSTYCDSGD